MLYKALKKELETHFPLLGFTSNDKEKLITIPYQHKDVGEIIIYDDKDEFTISVEKFTHWHIGCIDRKSKDINQIEEAVSDVVNFLEDMLNDKIFMYGSSVKGGGASYIDDDFSTNKQGYVWSGPYEKKL
jgi:hypothetical protein